MNKRPNYNRENTGEQYAINDHIDPLNYVKQPPLKRFHFNNDLLFEATADNNNLLELINDSDISSSSNNESAGGNYTPGASGLQKTKSMSSVLSSTNEIISPLVQAVELGIDMCIQEDTDLNTNLESLDCDDPVTIFSLKCLSSDPSSNQMNNPSSSSTASLSILLQSQHPIESTQPSKKLIYDYFSHRSVSPTLESAFLNKSTINRNRHSDTAKETVQIQNGEELINNSDCHCRVCNAVVNNADYESSQSNGSSSSSLNTKITRTTTCFQRCGYCTRSSCLVTCSMACECCRELFCKFCIVVDYTSNYERVLCPDCNT